MKFVLNTPPSPILTITFLLQLSIYPLASQRSHIILTLNSFFPEIFLYFFFYLQQLKQIQWLSILTIMDLIVLIY